MMNKEQEAKLMERYGGSDVPGLRICKPGSDYCALCLNFEGCAEVDCCTKHKAMYHDWDMPEEINFAFSMVCDDFGRRA
jgi:hypothetical protein